MSSIEPATLTSEEAAERMRVLVEECLPVLIMTIDRDHRITWINRYLHGLTAEQVLGVSAFAFLPAEFHDIARRAFEHVFRTGEPTRYETVGYAPGSATVWYTVYVGPVRREGEITSLALATEDITERKRLEQQLNETVARLSAYTEELEEKNLLLSRENEERQRTELALRQQREVVSRMATPIIQAWEGVLVLPVVGVVDGDRATHMMEKLLAEISQRRARFAVLDLTGVDAVDTSTVSHLLQIVRAASLLGSRCLVSGISPAIAQTMVSLGSGLEGLATFAQLQDALRFAIVESGAVTARPAPALRG